MAEEEAEGDEDAEEVEEAVEEVAEVEATPAEEEVVEEATPAVEESPSEDVDYSSMTVAELKELLKAAGKPVSGKKAELIERLQE
jgi:isochorismate hydrolase